MRAPATRAGASDEAEVGSVCRSNSSATAVKWTPAKIIESIVEWNDRFGSPPRASDLNPAAARWAGQSWRVERYLNGRVDGGDWPSLSTVKRCFDGSFTSALRAAGFEPGTRGPAKRSNTTRAMCNPELDSARIDLPPDARLLLDLMTSQFNDQQKQIERLRSELERVDNEQAKRIASLKSEHTKQLRKVELRSTHKSRVIDRLRQNNSELKVELRVIARINDDLQQKLMG